jgi:hypothetical protein
LKKVWLSILVLFVLIMAPRQIVARMRRGLADFVLWQWVRMSAVSHHFYEYFYERKNGQNKQSPENIGRYVDRD